MFLFFPEVLLFFFLSSWHQRIYDTSLGFRNIAMGIFCDKQDVHDHEELGILVVGLYVELKISPKEAPDKTPFLQELSR